MSITYNADFSCENIIMNFLSIIILCFLFLQTLGRPAHVLQDYKDSKDNLYGDGENGDSDDYLHNEQKSSLKQFSDNEHDIKSETLGDNVSNTNEAVYRTGPDKDYLESNDEDQADIAHIDKLSMGNAVKRAPARKHGIMLFHNNEEPRKGQRLDYYDVGNNVDRDAVNRDRRQTKNNYLSEPPDTLDISTQKNELVTNEDEENAIRRHVKNLSKEELNELLQSLSEEKRALLRNIIDNPQQEEYLNINKREITKKAGANEENNFVGNEQSDASKINGGSANLEAESSMAPDSEKDNTKKTEIESVSSNIASSSEKPSEKVNALEGIEDKKLVKADSIENLQSSQTEANIVAIRDTEQELSKKESKREISSKSQGKSESNNEDLYCSQNEEFAQLWNEETNLPNANKYKREVCADDFDSITSLEESFPNADNINNINPESDMAPLVRVKRYQTDKNLEKRDVNVLSNIKVPYFSSALENNEEDNDEGSEFQEEGYFDRRANGPKSSEIIRQGNDLSRDNKEKHIKYCDNSRPVHVHNNKLDTDTASLGSDTDVVLSGIEGVDDNMMYNSVARIKRTRDSFDTSSIEDENGKNKQESLQQLESQNEGNEMSEDNNNAPRYQENDAFGSLPRNYVQDLGRFKRIRRLKTENNVPVVEH